MTDLQAKYQILATEYSKLRAQVPVLKKAVLDEQANEELLKENIKEKDQSIRKFEQEVDSLTFRNQQLSSRVAQLQQDLEEVNVRKKNKSKHAAPHDGYGAVIGVGGGGGREDNSIIGEELWSKIEENARLHRQVSDAAEDHRLEMTRLQEQLSTLQTEAARHDGILNAAVQANRDKVNKLQEDKAMLEVKLQRQEKETKEAVLRSTELQAQVDKLEREMGSEMKRMSATLQRKLPFNDTADKSLNSFNVPCHDHQHHLVAKELISQASSLVRDLLGAFGDFYARSEERAKIFRDTGDGERLRDVNKKFCEHLREHDTVIKRVKQSFQTFHDSINDDSLLQLETVSQLDIFAAEWSQFTAYVQKLLPYQMLTLEEECTLSSCPNTLLARNMELHSSLQRLASTFCRLDNYITLLSSQSKPNNGHAKSSQAKMFEHMSKVLNDFHECLRDLSRHFNAKLSLEHQLPTATQRLKVTDECILSAIISLVTSSSKISAFFSGNLSFFISSSAVDDDVVDVSTNPAVTLLRQRAIDYMSLINRPPCESVPYEVALQNRKTVYSFTESKDTLTQQVMSLQEKLTRLEQEREHWLLDTQLLQMKYQKEAQKVSALQQHGVKSTTEPGATNGPTPASLPTAGTVAGHSSASSIIATSLLGQVEVVASSDGGGEEGEGRMREQLITKHYEGRIADTTLQLQQADSKALHYYAECRALQKRLNIREKEKEKMHEDLTASNRSVAQLKDELQTTTRSYEGQLSMMSEHLAGMNERLTTQKDEIDLLKYQLQNNNRGTLPKKGKPAR